MQDKKEIHAWIKQAFCKHEWKQVGGFCRLTDQAFHVECMSEVLECNKCGKRKQLSMKLPGRMV